MRVEPWEKQILRAIYKKVKLGIPLNLAVLEESERVKVEIGYVHNLWACLERELQKKREKRLLKTNARCPTCRLPLVDDVVTAFSPERKVFKVHSICLKTEIQMG
jgi:hypothetical protein